MSPVLLADAARLSRPAESAECKTSHRRLAEHMNMSVAHL